MEQRERLAALRAEMKQQGVDIYLIPTADFHNSEYVGNILKCAGISPDLPGLREPRW